MAAEKIFTLKNTGATEAVFTLEQPPAGWVARPMRAAVPPGQATEVALEVTAAEPAALALLARTTEVHVGEREVHSQVLL